ncbi:hypothetical protein CR513_39202, partial [Mucuna pruriens]
MIGERSMFLNVRLHKGLVFFGGNGKVGKDPLPIIDNVIYVKGLKYNLLNISQFCDSMLTMSLAKTLKNNNLYKNNLEDLNKQLTMVRVLEDLSPKSRMTMEYMKKLEDKIENLGGGLESIRIDS